MGKLRWQFYPNPRPAIISREVFHRLLGTDSRGFHSKKDGTYLVWQFLYSVDILALLHGKFDNMVWQNSI